MERKKDFKDQLVDILFMDIFPELMDDFIDQEDDWIAEGPDLTEEGDK